MSNEKVTITIKDDETGKEVVVTFTDDCNGEWNMNLDLKRSGLKNGDESMFAQVVGLSIKPLLDESKS